MRTTINVRCGYSKYHRSMNYTVIKIDKISPSNQLTKWYADVPKPSGLFMTMFQAANVCVPSTSLTSLTRLDHVGKEVFSSEVAIVIVEHLGDRHGICHCPAFLADAIELKISN